MSHFRILDDNYAFSSQVNVFGSSEDPQYPASNVKKYIRSKVWRSYGYWKITTSNNKLDFDIGGGEVTATITVGEYSTADLITEIETQMGVAGTPDTFTVAQTNGIFSIGSDGSTLSLLRNSGSNLANSIWSTIGFGTDSDSTGAPTYEAASIALHTEEGLVIDLNTSEEIDSVAVLLDPNDTQYRLSDTAVVTLQASDTNSWASPPYSQVLTIDDTYDVYTLFLTSPIEYRYYRIKIVDPRNANLYVSLSKVFLAKATVIQNPEIGFVHNIKDGSKSQGNDFGHVYTDLYPLRKSLEFNFSALSKEDTETLYTIYSRVGSAVPICIALDYDESLFDKDRFFMYGRLTDSIKLQHRFYSYFDGGLTLEEAL